MVRLILAIIITCMLCVPSTFARSFVVSLQANGTVHHIDKDSIQLAGQSSTMRMVKATMSVNHLSMRILLISLIFTNMI